MVIGDESVSVLNVLHPLVVYHLVRFNKHNAKFFIVYLIIYSMAILF